MERQHAKFRSHRKGTGRRSDRIVHQTFPGSAQIIHSDKNGKAGIGGENKVSAENTGRSEGSISAIPSRPQIVGIIIRQSACTGIEIADGKEGAAARQIKKNTDPAIRVKGRRRERRLFTLRRSGFGFLRFFFYRGCLDGRFFRDDLLLLDGNDRKGVLLDDFRFDRESIHDRNEAFMDESGQGLRALHLNTDLKPFTFLGQCLQKGVPGKLLNDQASDIGPNTDIGQLSHHFQFDEGRLSKKGRQREGAEKKNQIQSGPYRFIHSVQSFSHVKL